MMTRCPSAAGLLGVTMLVTLLACCASPSTLRCPDGSTISGGVDEAVVQAQYGLPDVIGESSGDETRLYSPYSRPEYYWPRKATTKLYYLGRDSTFRIENGGLVAVTVIDPELRSMLQEIAERSTNSQRRGIGGRE
jgi:hypothetical protein